MINDVTCHMSVLSTLIIRPLLSPWDLFAESVAIPIYIVFCYNFYAINFKIGETEYKLPEDSEMYQNFAPLCTFE